MSRPAHCFILLSCFSVFGAEVRADDGAVAKQRQTADAVIKSLQVRSMASFESKNLILNATLPDARLKSLATTLEKQYAAALKALQFDKDETPWPGKLTVYIFTDRSDFRSFVRQVEKRSVDDAELGSVLLKDDTPHAAAGPGRTKDAPTPEAQSGYQIAAALLSTRAKNVPVPEWVVSGFGRATAAQAAGTSAGNRKRAARALSAQLKPTDVWNDATPKDAKQILATSIADFLFYGKGAAKPADFLNGFRPDDDKPMKTAVAAVAAINLTPEQFEAAYRKWLLSNN